MRSLLILGYVALALGAGILAAYAAPADAAPRYRLELASMNQLALGASNQRLAVSVESRDVASVSGAEHPGDAGGQSFFGAAGTIIVLAGAGIIVALAAVGLRRVWIQNPIRGPYGEGSGFL